MLRKHISLLLSIIMLLGLFTIAPTAISAADTDIADTAADANLAETGYTIPSETAFATRLAQLKETYYPNGYSGAYYENGSAMAWQCFGYAVQMLYDVFGARYYSDSIYDDMDYNMGEIYAGDIVRIRGDSHSIFITRVTDEGYYFTDANWDYNNGVRWDAYYTKAEMASTFTYKIHIPGHHLTGSGTAKTGLYLDNPRLKGTKCSAPGITVYWYPVEGAASYRVYYRGGDQKTWKSLGVTENTYYKFISDLDYGTNYIFTVRCLDAYGQLVSAYDKAGISVKYAVANPELISATPSVDKVDLSWSAVSTVKYYRVFAKAAGDAKWRALSNVKGTSYSFTGGKANTEYLFTVRCLSDNKDFISGCSNTLTAHFTPYGSQVAAPENIIPTAATQQGNIKIKWDAVRGAKYYMVFYKIDGVSTGWKKLGVTTKNYYYHTGCTNDTPYRYTVRCVDAKNVFISDYFKEGAPIRFYHFPENQKAVKHDEYGGVKISWNAVSGAYAYALYYKTDDMSGWKRVITDEPITGHSYIFNGCENGVKYTFTVRCTDETGALISSYNYKGASIVYEGNPPVEEVAETAVGDADELIYAETGTEQTEATDSTENPDSDILIVA